MLVIDKRLFDEALERLVMAAVAAKTEDGAYVGSMLPRLPGGARRGAVPNGSFDLVSDDRDWDRMRFIVLGALMSLMGTHVRVSDEVPISLSRLGGSDGSLVGGFNGG